MKVSEVRGPKVWPTPLWYAPGDLQIVYSNSASPSSQDAFPESTHKARLRVDSWGCYGKEQRELPVYDL